VRYCAVKPGYFEQTLDGLLLRKWNTFHNCIYNASQQCIPCHRSTSLKQRFEPYVAYSFKFRWSRNRLHLKSIANYYSAINAGDAALAEEETFGKRAVQGENIGRFRGNGSRRTATCHWEPIQKCPRTQ